MTVLDVVKTAATTLGLEVPDQVFGSTSRTMIEMQALVNRVAELIRDEYDWQAFQAIASIAGDGAADDFALPADYARMPKRAALYPVGNPNMPLEHVLSTDDWLNRELHAFTNPIGEWAIFGNRINIRPRLGNAQQVKYVYVKNTMVKPASGANKARFTADLDSFVLPERLLELGIIWNWKAAKNQAYASQIDEYENALALAIDTDRGSKPTLSGSTKLRGVKTAWPWRVGESA